MTPTNDQIIQFLKEELSLSSNKYGYKARDPKDPFTKGDLQKRLSIIHRIKHEWENVQSGPVNLNLFQEEGFVFSEWLLKRCPAGTKMEKKEKDGKLLGYYIDIPDDIRVYFYKKDGSWYMTIGYTGELIHTPNPTNIPIPCNEYLAQYWFPQMVYPVIATYEGMVARCKDCNGYSMNEYTKVCFDCGAFRWEKSKYPASRVDGYLPWEWKSFEEMEEWILEQPF